MAAIVTSGAKGFRRIQLGRETTTLPGTAVPATTIWGAEGTMIKDDRQIEPVAVDVGRLLPYPSQFTKVLGATIQFGEAGATFEQLPYILAASLENTITPAAVGSGHLYQYDLGVTTAQTVRTFTIESGDNIRADEMENSFVEEFTLSGSQGETITVSANWRGRQALDAELTTPLTIPTVEHINFAKGSFCIDATTIGTTPKTNTLSSFSLTVPSGLVPLYTPTGGQYFATLKRVRTEPTGELVMEHNATSEAEITAARAHTVRLIRMRFLGVALATPVTLWTAKTLNIDMAIQYTDVPEISDEDEDDVLSFPFRVIYLAAATLGLQINVVNNVGTLP